MANSQYYRQNAPGWGTNQLQFSQPPPPNFQPQPNWGGQDYYNAHAVNPDSSIFDHAWGRVRQYSGSSLDQGVGVHEAKHWHRRAYGGLGDVGMMLPAEIGHAAAYEAYRTWTNNSSLYEPLSGDVERQREGLIGLAIAEASRLLQYTNRSMDNYSRMAASDAAAATASIIYYHYRDREEGEYHRSRSRTRRGSGSSYDYDDSYGSDRRSLSSSFPRQRSRSRARSLSRSPMLFPGSQMAGSMGPSAPMSMPGAAGSGYGGTAYPGAAGNAYPGAAGNAYTGTPYPGGAGSAYSDSSYPGSIPMPMQGQSPYSAAAGMPMAASQSYGSYGSMPAYGSMPQSYGVPMAATQSYSTAPRVITLGSRPRSTSMSIPGYAAGQYPQVQYATSGQYMQQVPYVASAQPQTIILGSGHRKHHRSKKSKRSRSTGRHSRY